MSEPDDVDPADGRTESAPQRADRNWVEILQELRVTQTGTQIISGFLLTIVFQQRFSELDGFQVSFYLVLVVLSAACTALGLAPVALHRQLFRHHEKVQTVAIANRLLRTTLALVALLTSGVVFFVFDVTVGPTAGIVAGGVVLAVLVVLLYVFPRAVLRRVSPRQPSE
ncbi:MULTISPECIES: DUF6328 family protein [unclassified Leifsonia]|uniref:DUF6328 family protein n=1 Tax=unclassified Leifsonia TaxID=2663824 RepID=UPI000A1989FB|nr:MULTISPECIES: DUF6328 family protein [unclassified Leifsonia]QIZ97157.1 sodium:proton antiporter [Leifsonia sp. PS1209]